MKISIIMAVLVLLVYTGYAQTNYYRYNSAGVPEKVGYSEPVNNKPFGEYIPVIDPHVYGNMVVQKQRQYDANVQSIRNLVNEISTLLNEVYQYDVDYSQRVSSSLIQYLKSISRDDFGNSRIYTDSYTFLSELKGIIENTKKDIIEEYYKEKYSNSQVTPIVKKEINRNICTGVIIDIDKNYNDGGVEVLMTRDVKGTLGNNSKNWFNISIEDPQYRSILKIGAKIGFLYYAEGSGGHLYFENLQLIE